MTWPTITDIIILNIVVVAALKRYLTLVFVVLFTSLPQSHTYSPHAKPLRVHISCVSMCVYAGQFAYNAYTIVKSGHKQIIVLLLLFHSIRCMPKKNSDHDTIYAICLFVCTSPCFGFFLLIAFVLCCNVKRVVPHVYRLTGHNLHSSYRLN